MPSIELATVDGAVPGVVACIMGGSIRPGSENVIERDVTGLALAFGMAFPPGAALPVPLVFELAAARRVASFTS